MDGAGQAAYQHTNHTHIPISHQGPSGIHTMPQEPGLKQEFSWISLSSRS
jgi:hypothetical protein